MPIEKEPIAKVPKNYIPPNSKAYRVKDRDSWVSVAAANGIDPWDLKFWCSGSKGFHAEIPARFFGLQDGHVELPLIYKRLVQGWVDKLGLTTVDLSMYCMKRGKMFRLANVKRSNGRYKVPLTRDDVAFCDIESLLRLSESPRSA